MAPTRTGRRSCWLGRAVVLGIMFLGVFAASSQAQVVTDPRIAEFDPSPDHWTTLDNGQPAVVRYELNVYAIGASQPFATVNMGKPSPDKDGKIRYDFTSAAATWPLPGGSYEARVSAVGPEGAALSDPSNPFTFSSSSCTYTLNANAVSAPASGGSYSVGVSTSTGCTWLATTSLAWVSLSATSGSGAGSVPFQVQANTSTSNRSGTITVAGQAVTVSQAGTAATTTFGKVSPANGVTGQGSTVTVTWSAVADAGYWVCWDTTNNNTCDGSWWPNGGGAARALTGLPAGTYYWQVRAQTARGTFDADNGTWWSFTVAGATTAPAAFGKASPASGAAGLTSALTLSWGAATGATAYQVCVDTTNDSACGTTWQSAGAATSLAQSGLAAGTYYWQVRAQNAGGVTDANSGTWWSFTVAGTTTAPAAFGKTAPSSGTGGLGSPVTLSWGASAGATGYQVCADTTNDSTCSAAWQSAGTATTLALTGLPAGTYYWQVRAQNSSGTTDANGGTWWSFTVTTATSSTFTKSSPSNGLTGQGSAVTVTWSAVADAGYWVCWDTTNNNTCDGSWWPNGGGAGRTLTGLPNGTYYWQVMAQTASGTTEANGGTWWSFTVGGSTQPPAAFGKVSPASGATGLGSSTTLSWGAATGATAYLVCVDTTNDNACSTAWQSAGAATTLAQSGLAAGTYYWQVRAQNTGGTTDANSGAWWSFTVAGSAQPPSTFGKTSPTAGATGLGSGVTLGWSAVADAGYWVCWDTTNNNTCDGSWWPNGGVTARALAGLSAGTYYWQVRAQTASGTADADNGTWWSFTVGGSTQPPLAFGKVSPSSGATGLSSALTLAWGSSSGATGYEVCVDTTNDNACSTTWRSAWASTSVGLSGLTPGTYYWQARALNASGTTNADGDQWWAFTVSATASAFAKLAPANGTIDLGSSVTLQWTPMMDAGYWVCWDTTNNNTCDGSWWPNGGGAARALTGLPAGTYYWQVRAQTATGTLDADSGTWFTFTVR